MSKNFLSGHRKWNTLAFRGRLMSLLVLTHSGVSPRPFLPQESSCISFANMVFGIARFHYYDGCLERRTVDSCGNSTCLKTPQSGFLEEAEAVPAESNGPQRKTPQRIRCSLYILFQKQQYFRV